jgi:type I restriction enzyme M protein
MAVKKSDLYNSLWAGCNELRGSMDESQYKDYVLVLLFLKYIFDKGGDLIDIPDYSSILSGKIRLI